MHAFNLNDTLHFRLTAAGLDWYRLSAESRDRPMRTFCAERGMEFVASPTEPRASVIGPGWSKMPAWEFARIFGPRLGVGAAQHIVDNHVRVESSIDVGPASATADDPWERRVIDAARVALEAAKRASDARVNSDLKSLEAEIVGHEAARNRTRYARYDEASAKDDESRADESRRLRAAIEAQSAASVRRTDALRRRNAILDEVDRLDEAADDAFEALRIVVSGELARFTMDPPAEKRTLAQVRAVVERLLDMLRDAGARDVGDVVATPGGEE